MKSENYSIQSGVILEAAQKLKENAEKHFNTLLDIQQSNVISPIPHWQHEQLWDFSTGVETLLKFLSDLKYISPEDALTKHEDELWDMLVNIYEWRENTNAIHLLSMLFSEAVDNALFGDPAGTPASHRIESMHEFNLCAKMLFNAMDYIMEFIEGENKRSVVVPIDNNVELAAVA